MCLEILEVTWKFAQSRERQAERVRQREASNKPGFFKHGSGRSRFLVTGRAPSPSRIHGEDVGVEVLEPSSEPEDVLGVGIDLNVVLLDTLRNHDLWV